MNSDEDEEQDGATIKKRDKVEPLGGKKKDLTSKEERRKDRELEKRKQAELELLLMDDAALR